MPINSENHLIYKQRFGKNLRELRRNAGMTQLDLASIIDIDKASISRIENGRANIMLSTSVSIAKALNVPLYKLFDFPI